MIVIGGYRAAVVGDAVRAAAASGPHRHVTGVKQGVVRCVGREACMVSSQGAVTRVGQSKGRSEGGELLTVNG